MKKDYEKKKCIIIRFHNIILLPNIKREVKQSYNEHTIQILFESIRKYVRVMRLHLIDLSEQQQQTTKTKIARIFKIQSRRKR